MNLRLDIGRLVLDGINLAAGDQAQLKAAVEKELARLMALRGLSPELQSGGAVPASGRLPSGLAAQAPPPAWGNRSPGRYMEDLGKADERQGPDPGQGGQQARFPLRAHRPAPAAERARLNGRRMPQEAAAAAALCHRPLRPHGSAPRRP